MDSEILQKLERLEAMLVVLVERQTVRDYYDVDAVARLLGKAPFTVREWCRLGRIHAERKHSGRGAYLSYAISHDEVVRVQKEGLLPLKKT